jgi:hypothetical protein
MNAKKLLFPSLLVGAVSLVIRRMFASRASARPVTGNASNPEDGARTRSAYPQERVRPPSGYREQPSPSAREYGVRSTYPKEGVRSTYLHDGWPEGQGTSHRREWSVSGGRGSATTAR